MRTNQDTIPVYNLRDYKGTDFVIKRKRANEVPAQFKIPHRHTGYGIDLLTRGELIYYMDFERFRVTAPSLVFLAPGQVFAASEINSDFEIITIAFNKEFLLSELQSVLFCWQCLFGSNVTSVDVEQVDELMTYVNLMLNEFNSNKSQKDGILRNLLNAFIISCGRLIQKKTVSISMDFSQNKIVRQFITLADTHYREKTQVTHYAEMLYVTPGHLNDTIKATIGKTAKQIIDEKRIMEAKRLLFWGEHSVKEIAGELNFDDDAYFNRFFKKHTGQTPALFQKTSVKSTINAGIM